MKLGILTKPLNFTEWLDTATRDLVPSAQGRVRPEIEAHYAEAVKSRLDKGSSETVAQAAALSDLGSPYMAAKRFRREYLTASDTRLIARMLKPNRGVFWSPEFSWGLFCVILLDISAPYAQDTYHHIMFWVAVGLVELAILIASNLAARTLVTQSITSISSRQLLLFQAISRAIYWILFMELFWSILYMGAAPIFLFILPMVLCGYGYTLIHWLRVRQKLQTASDDDLASSRPTAA